MAFLRSFGCFLPDRVVSNDEIGSCVGSDSQWILNVSGIEARRFASDEETVAVMASNAGLDCLERGGVKTNDVEMVIVSSGTAERNFPGPAASVVERLGLKRAVGIDLPMASAGTLFGLSLADKMAEIYKNILVIGAEKMSEVVMRQPMDKATAVLFGDGAGACLVSRNEGQARVVASQLFTDGQFTEDLRLEHSQPLAMNGRSVILQASRKVPAAIAAVLQMAGMKAEEVDVFLMHQANQNLIDRVATAVGVAAEKFYSNIRHYGNTSSASMLIAAAEWSRAHGFRKGAPVLFAAFGAGYHWGALAAVGE